MCDTEHFSFSVTLLMSCQTYCNMIFHSCDIIFVFILLILVQQKHGGIQKMKTLSKNKFNYQVSSLLSEKNKPFDIYMIDGRYRLACVLISLLHAASSGTSSSSSASASSRSSALLSTSSSSSNSGSSTTTHHVGPIVLLHDCVVQNSTRISRNSRTANDPQRSHFQFLNSILDQIDSTAKVST